MTCLRRHFRQDIAFARRCTSFAGWALALLAAASLASPAFAAFNNATPRGSFAGTIDYVTIGGTLRNSASNQCSLTGSSSATLGGIPSGSTIARAYLYWGGSGPVNDPTVTFAGGTVNASANFDDTDVDGYRFFGHVADVTTTVQAMGQTSYSFSGLTVENGTAGGLDYCSIALVQAGWALVVVYEHASEPNRVINVYDGLQSFWGQQITTTPGNFLIPASPVNGKTTIITWEGDTANSGTRNGLSERVTFNGSSLTDGSCNPSSGIYNSTINCGGVGAGYGVDIDTYSIGAYLASGQTSGTLVYSSGADQVYLAAQVVSTTNAPVADLSIAKSHAGNFTAGSTGTYAIAVHNNGPAATTGTTTVTDTLPTGLTYQSAGGSGWTCSAAGQTVTCTSNAVIADGGNFPSIGLVVNVTAAGGASVDNTASVSGTRFDNVGGNNSDTDPTTILSPDLSTSTKGVVDLNGGDANPGDTLRYTITLVETAGVAASNATVTDARPANTTFGGALNPATTCIGTDASISTQVQMNGISVPASGSCTIVFDVTVNAVAPGVTIDNTATIAPAAGIGAAPAAPTVVVSQSQVAASGNKILYVYDNNQLTRTPQATTNTDGVTIGTGGNDSWVLTPAVAAGKSLVLSAGAVAVNLRMRCTGGFWCQYGSQPAIVDLLRGGTVLASSSPQNIQNQAFEVKTFTISLGSAQTIAAGQALSIRVRNTGGGFPAQSVAVSQYNGGRSTISFATSTVVNVDSVAIYSAAYPSTATKSQYVQGDTVFVRAVIGDPFGAYDVTGARLRLSDGAGTVVLDNAAMNAQAPAETAATKTFEGNYTIAANPRIGTWTARVTGVEGTEVDGSGNPTVTHSRNGPLTVHGRVTLGKTWSGATAGNAVALAIAGGSSTTAGSSSAPSTTTQAVAAAAASATLALSESFTNGSAGNYTPALACTRVKDSVAVPVTGTGLSRTITMPGDSAVACAWSNTWTVPLTVVKLSTVVSDPVNGTTNPKAIPGAIVEYRIIVTNPAPNPVDADSVFVTDVLPGEVELWVGDIGGPGPVLFNNGAPSSGLSYNFASLASTSDDIAFSNNGGGAWTYSPSGSSTDAAVNAIRINPKGVFNANNAQFNLRFRVRLK